MYILLLAILVLSSISLIVLVLMQSGKGSGLSGAFGSAGGGESSLFGANTATVVMKATAVFAVIFMLSCILVAFWQRRMYKPLSFEKIKSEERIEPGFTAGKKTVEEKEKDKKEPTEESTPAGEDTGVTTDETKAGETESETKEGEETETPKEPNEEPAKEESAPEGGTE